MTTSSCIRRPEEVLLLACCPVNPCTATRLRMEALLRNELDWDYVLTIARRHGVLPLLQRNLKHFGSDLVPARVSEVLDDHFHFNALRNLFLSGELLRIVNLLEAHGISAIPFKGPVLAASIYGNPALREFIDLDILVRKPDVRRARDLLIREGYILDLALTESEQAARLRSGCAMSFSRKDGKAIVDLHWEFASSKFSLPFNLDDLWSRKETVTIAGHEVGTLSTMDHLLLLSVHGAKHRWERLEWISDVAALVLSHPILDWKRCFEEAAKLRAERILVHTLLVASQYLGIVLPSEVRQKVEADPVANSLAARVGETLFAKIDSALVTAEETAFHLQMREQLSDKWPYIFHQVRRWMIPTERDRTVFNLPAFLSLLYYPLRPARLLFEYGLNPFSQFLKNLRVSKS